MLDQDQPQSREKVWNLKFMIIYSSMDLMDLQPFVGSWPLLQFCNPIHSWLDSLNRDQPIARPLPTQSTAQTWNKGTQASMP
jgi:hypothetical protein